ncbi:MAG TPA: hypothetical protein VM866_02405 [Pyrinomonadaceae bacterium]|nr:hypothetical protein [Pyrinomonadaceae bacterium]
MVGNELSVQAVLLGRVVQRGDQLTLSLDLVDARTDDQIWGERYNRKQTELLSLQSEIARDVSNKLRTRLSNADEQRVTKTYTADREAYQLYLQGLTIGTSARRKTSARASRFSDRQLTKTRHTRRLMRGWLSPTLSFLITVII